MVPTLHTRSNLNKIAEDSDDGSESDREVLFAADIDIEEDWKKGFDRFEDIVLSDKDCFRVYFGGNSGPLIVCLHGAGASGLSYTLFAKCAKPFCRMVAIDFRGHGHTKCEEFGDLSAKRLVTDTIRIINHILPNTDTNSHIPIILIGHSMGGGIAVHVASEASIKDRIKGLIVIDVVEGTAMSSLGVMTSVLQRRPATFYSYEEAINWSVDTRLLHNLASARISIPDQLKPFGDHLVWKTNLFDSQSYWAGWYENMSQRYLDSPAIKVLVLAGRERLDTPLTIGHMQGKFQMILLNGLGHYIQEDAPEEMGRILQRYLTRYNFLGSVSAEDALAERIKRERGLLFL